MKISKHVLSILTTAVLLISTFSFTALANDISGSDLPDQSGAKEEPGSAQMEYTIPIDPQTIQVNTQKVLGYTVEFAYKDQEFVLPGDSSIELSKILSIIGITGPVSEVEVSNDSLFSASLENGEWIVTAHSPFLSEEWMKVKIDGIIYEIAVTDSPLHDSYYFYVAICDRYGTGPYDSCANSAGYIIMPLTNGGFWYSEMPENIMDVRYKQMLFGYGDVHVEGSPSYPSYDFRKQLTPVQGFPTELKLVTEFDPNSTSYIKNNNWTYTSKWLIELYASGDLDKEFQFVEWWNEETVIHGSWSDKKEVTHGDSPHSITNVQGPVELQIPLVGQPSTTARYKVDVISWYNTLLSSNKTYVKRWELNSNFDYITGITVQKENGSNDGILTISDQYVKDYANNGIGDKKIYIAAYDDNSHWPSIDIMLRWPKCKVTFKDADGSVLKGPDEVNAMTKPVYPKNPSKASDFYEHHIFDHWDRNPASQSQVIESDTVFTAVYNTEKHDYKLDAAGTSHVCSKCGYKVSLADRLKGNGTENDPWQISSASDWDYVGTYLEACGFPENKYFALTTDIILTASNGILGTEEHPFSGCFDGRGHIIRLSVSNDNSHAYYAPFLKIRDAVIENVLIKGSVTNPYCSGVVDTALGTNLINNCKVEANLAGYIVAGMLRTGQRTTTTIENCVFSGGITLKNFPLIKERAATLCGWCDSESEINVIGCLDLSYSKYPLGVGDPDSSKSVVNTYYIASNKQFEDSTNPWDDQGKLACDLYSANGIVLSLVGDTGLEYGSRIYVGEGETFSFTAKKDNHNLSKVMFTDKKGVEQHLISDDDGVFTLIANSGVIDFDLSLSGKGTEDLPYLIYSTDDWNELAFYIEIGRDTTDLHFKLMNDISITTQIGTKNPFLGYFDGNGHEITADFNGIDNVAPFSKVGDNNSKTHIKDLKVTGNIYASGKESGGLVGIASGSLSVSNCVSDVVILTSYNGAGSNGGFVGKALDQSAVTIEGSVFTGKILTTGDTTQSAGFVGYGISSTAISNCLYNPAKLSEGENECTGSATFTGTAGNVDHCYYIRPMGEVQGKAVLTVTEGDEYVEIINLSLSGDPLANYNLSGITAYAQGISYRGTPLYGKGDTVGLELAHKDRDGYSFIRYHVEHATLTAAGDKYEITLRDSDAKITGLYIVPTESNDPEIEIEDQEFIYNGQEFTPSVLKVKVGTTSLPDSEYEVSYSNNINAGTATVIITDKPGGFFTVNGSKTFVIEPKEITLSWADTVFDFDGKAHCPLATAQGLIGDDICDVTVDGAMTDPGSYKAVATGLSNSNYKLPQDNSIEFKINAKPTPTATPTATVAPKPTEAAKPTGTATPTGTAKPTGAAKPTGTAKPTTAAKPATTAKPTNAVKPTAATKGGAPKLDKTSASLVCGKTMTLKATAKGNVKITWKSSDPKIATVDNNGKVTAKMAGAVTITATASGKSAKCAFTVLYKDVTNTKDFWYAPTNYLTAAGVVKGYANQTEFRPANICTRAQMVTFIWRLQGEPKPKATSCKFTDVKKTDYFYKACIWGNENHIVEGYKDGTFGPQIVCARKHAVTFLWRLADKPAPKSSANKFKDVKKSDYFYTATLWASEKGILAGYDDGTFRPNGDCLRRQMVTFLYKYDKFINLK